MRGFFIKNRAFSLDEKVSTIIAQIACFENALPQGSPSSPIIADTIAHLLDVRLVQLAKKCRAQYSRYADDITFSTNERQLPRALAVQSNIHEGRWMLSQELRDRIVASGFAINDAKTRMQCRNGRQLVTGLTVNTKVNVPASYYRYVRSMCHAVFKIGEYYRPGSASKVTSSLQPLEGMLNYVYEVKVKKAPKTDRISKGDKASSVEALYRRFLEYRVFASPPRPLIICEGKTDSVYLKMAIRRLSRFQPKLGTMTKDGFQEAVSFFSYEGQAHTILNIKGGTGDLKFLLQRYPDILAQFDHKPMLHPVIVLVDNDDGAKDIFALLKSKYKINVDYTSTDPFFRVTNNLYLVKTPSLGKKGKSCIEDLFPRAVRKIKLDGTVFNPNKNSEAKGEYGKFLFAERVVRPNAYRIRFTKFATVLSRFVGAIDDYASVRAAR